MYNDITDYFLMLIEQTGSYDIAQAEFKHQLSDPDLRADYIEWCEAMGYSERDGFTQFCMTHQQDHDDMWNTLNDYDE